MTASDETTIALTIAGSDSSAGAGLQADLKTFAALGVYGTSVVTALTAQNTREVREVWGVPDGCVAKQCMAVLDDLPVKALKLGMLHREGVIREVADILRNLGQMPVVCDTVMTSSTGAVLLEQGAIEAFVSELIPLADVITPNVQEAALLLDEPQATDESQMVAQAERLLRFGAPAVLLTGGHLDAEQASDVLVWREGELQSCEVFRTPRIATRNTHGTGCTLSAAIAANLARGTPLLDAIAAAKEYVSYALAHADERAVGGGHGPVHHFYAYY